MAWRRWKTSITEAGYRGRTQTRLSATMILSGYGHYNSPLLSMTFRIELYLSQRLLAFKHVHIGYRLLAVSSTSRLSLGVVSHDRFIIVTPSAHPYGTPSVLSSYSRFYDTSAGAPNGGMTWLLIYPIHFTDSSYAILPGTGTCADTGSVNRW
jgi:hypothetical protein